MPRFSCCNEKNEWMDKKGVVLVVVVVHHRMDMWVERSEMIRSVKQFATSNLRRVQRKMTLTCGAVLLFNVEAKGDGPEFPTSGATSDFVNAMALGCFFNCRHPPSILCLVSFGKSLDHGRIFMYQHGYDTALGMRMRTCNVALHDPRGSILYFIIPRHKAQHLTTGKVVATC